ncbi:MAG: ABC transporter permease [Chlorobiota bacterium]
MGKYNKIKTIIAHEYISKVKTKGFLIGTILGPLGLVALLGIIVYISMSFGDTSKKLAIVDQSTVIEKPLVAADTSLYYSTQKSIAELKEELQKETIDGYVVIPEDILDKGEASVYTTGGGGLGLISSLESDLNKIVRVKRLERIGTDPEVIDLIKQRVSVNTNKITETGETEQDDTKAMAYVGYGLGFAMYFLVFIYGSFVSRGVIEEKSNRIIEVLASSAKPFEIMMGKVIGIGFVGLTQIIFWLLLGFGLLTLLGPLIFGDPESMKGMTEMAQAQGGNMMDQTQGLSIPGVDITLVLGFLFYFIMGYFTYATFFAGVGAAVDNEQDAAQLQLPVTLPIILAIMITPQIMNNPDSTLAVVLSIVPLTSPLIMIVRIAATNVPIIEIIASAAALIGFFFVAVWVSAKIYRIGILMTGKKPKFSDLVKWIKA